MPPPISGKRTSLSGFDTIKTGRNVGEEAGKAPSVGSIDGTVVGGSGGVLGTHVLVACSGIVGGMLMSLSPLSRSLRIPAASVTMASIKSDTREKTTAFLQNQRLDPRS